MPCGQDLCFFGRSGSGLSGFRSFFGGESRVEIFVAGFGEKVVPLHEFADVAQVDAVAIPGGEGNVVHEVGELRFSSGFVRKFGGSAIEGIADVLEDEHERNVLGFGVHRHISEGGDAVACSGGKAAVGFVDGFDNEVAVATCNEFVETGLAGNGEKGFLHN